MARTANNGQPLLMEEVAKVFKEHGTEITYEQAVAALPEASRASLKEDYFKKLKYKARAGRLGAGAFRKHPLNAKEKSLLQNGSDELEKPKHKAEPKPQKKEVKPEELFDGKKQVGAGNGVPAFKEVFGDGPLNMTIGSKDNAFNAEVTPDKVKITTTILFEMTKENTEKVFQPTATLAAVNNAKQLIEQMGGNKEVAIKLIQML